MRRPGTDPRLLKRNSAPYNSPARGRRRRHRQPRLRPERDARDGNLRRRRPTLEPVNRRSHQPPRTGRRSTSRQHRVRPIRATVRDGRRTRRRPKAVVHLPLARQPSRPGEPRVHGRRQEPHTRGMVPVHHRLQVHPSLPLRHPPRRRRSAPAERPLRRSTVRQPNREARSSYSLRASADAATPSRQTCFRVQPNSSPYPRSHPLRAASRAGRHVRRQRRSRCSRSRSWRLARPANHRVCAPCFRLSIGIRRFAISASDGCPLAREAITRSFACSWLLSTGPAVSLAPRTLLLLGTGVLAPRRLQVRETRAASGRAHEAAAGKADGECVAGFAVPIPGADRACCRRDP